MSTVTLYRYLPIQFFLSGSPMPNVDSDALIDAGNPKAHDRHHGQTAVGQPRRIGTAGFSRSKDRGSSPSHEISGSC